MKNSEEFLAYEGAGSKNGETLSVLILIRRGSTLDETLAAQSIGLTNISLKSIPDIIPRGEFGKDIPNEVNCIVYLSKSRGNMRQNPSIVEIAHIITRNENGVYSGEEFDLAGLSISTAPVIAYTPLLDGPLRPVDAPESDVKYVEFRGTCYFKGAIYLLTVAAKEGCWNDDAERSVGAIEGVDARKIKLQLEKPNSFPRSGRLRQKRLSDVFPAPEVVSYTVTFTPDVSVTTDAADRKEETFYVRQTGTGPQARFRIMTQTNEEADTLERDIQERIKRIMDMFKASEQDEIDRFMASGRDNIKIPNKILYNFKVKNNIIESEPKRYFNDRIVINILNNKILNNEKFPERLDPEPQVPAALLRLEDKDFSRLNNKKLPKRPTADQEVGKRFLRMLRS